MATQPAAVIALDDHRFNLAARVREFIDDTSLDDLNDDALIERFISDLSVSEIRDALIEVLPRYFSDARRNAFRTAAAGGRSRWKDIDHNKISALRERVFNEWVITAEGRKRFGTCTAADVQYLADQRYMQSEANLAWAHKFEKVTKAMKRAKVATVADLGDQVVELIANA